MSDMTNKSGDRNATKSAATISAHDIRYQIVLPNAETDYIQKWLASERRPYEEEMLDAMRQRLKPNDLVLDIGANIGNHAIYLAVVAGCKVHAFEPNEELCSAFRRSVNLNGLEHLIHVESMALGKEHATGDFVESLPENLGQQRVKIGDGSIRIEMLDAVKFDEPVKAIKIDVEGMELAVLQGGEQLLRSSRPDIYVECQLERDFREVGNWLGTLGYCYWDTFNATPTHLFLPNENVTLEQRIGRLQFKVAEDSYKSVQERRKLKADLDVAHGESRRLNEQRFELKESLSKRQVELETIRRQLTGLQAVKGRLQQDLTQETIKNRELQSELESESKARALLQRNLDQVKDQLNLSRKARARSDMKLRATARTLRLFENSLSYYLGHALLDIAKHPITGGIKFPVRIARLMSRLLKRRTKRDEDNAIAWQAKVNKRPVLDQQALNELAPCDSPLVSVVLLVDKLPSGARTAVRSVLEQSYKNIECIVIQNNGADETFIELLDIARADTRVRLFRTSENHSPYWCLNFGMNKATGRFITFQADSQVAHKDKVAFHMRVMQSNPACVAMWGSRKSPTRAAGHVPADVTLRFDPCVIDLGYLDGSAILAVEEYITRVRSTFGSKRIFAIPRRFSKRLVKEFDSAYNVERVSRRHRRVYVDNYSSWRQRNLQEQPYGFLPYPLVERPFECPEEAVFANDKLRHPNVIYKGHDRHVVLGQVQELASDAKTVSVYSSVRLGSADPLCSEKRCHVIPLPKTTVGTKLFAFDVPAPGAEFMAKDQAEKLTFGVIGIEHGPDVVLPEASAGRPRVTVIMTAFNRERTISAAIDSVLRQTYPDFELIVVDDCSEDRTFDIAKDKAAADSRIRVFKMMRNQGTYWCKNFGLNKAVGEYVTFQDSDDWSLCHRLELQLATLLAHKSSIAVVGRYIRMTTTGEVEIFNGKKDRTALITLFYRRVEVLDKLGFYDTVRTGADSELFERMRAVFGAKAVKQINSTFYYALKADESLTASGDAKLEGSRSSGSFRQSPLRQNYVKSYRGWHRKISKGLDTPFLSFPALNRKFVVSSTLLAGQVGGSNCFVTASVASIPDRHEQLRQVVEAVLPQVDRLNVYLNGYEAAPAFLSNEKIVIARSQDHGDIKDNGKFFWADKLHPGYHFTLDDDIQYAPDYVRQTLLKLQQYENRVIVGYHGVNLANPLVNYIEGREVFLFSETLRRDRFVNLLGTGTVAYHTSLLTLGLSLFRLPGMADLWLAIEAKKRRVPMVCLSREKRWLTALTTTDEPLYRKAKRDAGQQTEVAQQEAPWGLDCMLDIYRPVALDLFNKGTRRALRSLDIDTDMLDRSLRTDPIHFSVIVTGWNAEQEADECCRSILQQAPGHFDYDVYLMDDGSSDRTYDILRSYESNENVRLFRNECNRGPAFSRWLLLNEVKRPQSVCVLVDMDDKLTSDALKTVADAYLDNPDAWMSYGNWEDQYGRRNPQGFYDDETIADRSFRRVELFNCAPLRTFRRFLFDDVRPEDMQDSNGDWFMYCSDVALMFPIMEQCGPQNIVTIAETLYIYNRHRPGGTIKRFGATRKRRARKEIARKAPKSLYGDQSNVAQQFSASPIG